MTTPPPEPDAPTLSEMEPATYVVDAVARLQRAVFQIGTVRLRSWNMTLSSYAALRILANRPDLTLAQLSRRGFVRPQTMTRIVSEHERRGYLERLPTEEGGRPLALRLTALGLDTLAGMDHEVNQINTTITRVLSSEEIDQLDSMLRRCAAAVEGEIAQAQARGVDTDVIPS